MKATLEFNLPDEREVFETAVKGWDYYMVLNDFDQWLRNQIKHNDMLSEQDAERYQKLREKLYDLLDERGLKMEL
jgi:hypothetical protein